MAGFSAIFAISACLGISGALNCSRKQRVWHCVRMGLLTGTIREYSNGSFLFNPVVTVVGFVVLWSLAIYCMVYQGEAKTELVEWRNWVSNVFTWLYIGTQDAWIAFAVWLF